MPTFWHKLLSSASGHLKHLKRTTGATGGLVTFILVTSLAQAHVDHRRGYCEKVSFTNYRNIRRMASSSRIPCAYVPHGGGPLPILGDKQHVELVQWLEKFVSKYLAGDKKPTSCLIISAHWEEKQPTVQSGEENKLYYDYYGFPEESYNLNYTLPGATDLAKRVTGLLQSAKVPCKVDKARGFDHGVFIPMKIMYPQGGIPTIQLSLVRGMDPATHIKIGEALAPLRDEGVFILGSGMSYHNMRGFNNPRSNQDSEPFHAYLRDHMVQAKSYGERKMALENWEIAPKARECHPREEHLIPLLVTVGTTKNDVGSDVREEFFADVAGVKCAGYVFQ